MIRFVPLLVVLCLPAAALAQNLLPKHLASMMEQQPDMAMRRILDDFLWIAPDGRLTPDDLAYAEARANASARAGELAAILDFDLDGDGAISADEVAAHRRHAAPDILFDLEYILDERDGDRDGTLSAAEVATFDPAGVAGRYGALGLDYRAMDLDGDGEVVTAEVLEAVRGMAAGEPAPSVEVPAVCAYPVPSAQAEIVLLAGSEANLLSTVTLAGQDEITRAGTIVIEEGGSPLYIVALVYEPTIWQVEGAIGRVEAFVLPDHAGATGLPRERVAFLAGGSCQPDLFDDAVTTRVSLIRLENALGRAPDGIIEEDEIGRIALPSGANDIFDGDIDEETFTILGGLADVVSEDPQERAGRPPMWRAISRLLLKHPGGVAAIAPSEVVAVGPVESYVVLPGVAGLIQLFEEGRLEVMDKNNTYRIVAPIPRLPSGLYGAHRATFFLAPGIAPPAAGSAGHSQVIDEATGDCLPDFICD